MALSPVLARRIDVLYGCQGSWFLIENGEPQNRWAADVSQSPYAALEVCLERRWGGVSLGFQPDYCGYSDYCSIGLVGKANFKHFQARYAEPEIIVAGYGWNGESIVVDLRFASDDLIESIVALENYPLADEELHSELELEEEQLAWHDWGHQDWLKAIAELLEPFAPETADYGWASDRVEQSVSAEVAWELFERCRESANQYWEVQDLSSGAYINLDRVARELSPIDLANLGLVSAVDLSVYSA